MSKQRNLAFQELGASAGIVAPIVGFICIISSISSYPQFNWTTNALSDLGIIPGTTSILFNFGLIASGLSAFNFAIFGLLTYFNKSKVGKIGSLVFTAATLALMAIGIFNESFSPTHYILSVAFFVLAPISLFILSRSFALTRQHKMTALTVAFGIASVIPWLVLFTFNYVPNVAIPEALSGVAISIWITVLSIRMLRTDYS